MIAEPEVFGEEFDLWQSESDVNAFRESYPHLDHYQFYMVETCQGEILKAYGSDFPYADRSRWDFLF